MFESRHFVIFGFIAISKNFVVLCEGRFCEGGHRCSAPKECCAQGCCYLYAPPSPPRTAPPAAATDHVLNLFFINHWYFWCVVLAIILALLCACSLWRKRRQLCGWGLPSGAHSHSEGDSAGSCYAPPQYSRCSSFHHAPPPYTEVTSKPDLYPLVFTCNGDGGKNGASYLMVQYFRNYIVRPAGSLSATSTVDSLSSSFICTVNEANTLVPPPYSRAASPDLQVNQQQQQQTQSTPSTQQRQYSHSGFSIPRSASQHATITLEHNNNNNLRPSSVPVVIASGGSGGSCSGGNYGNSSNCGTGSVGTPTSMIRFSESMNFPNNFSNSTNLVRLNPVTTSRSDHQLKLNPNGSNSNSHHHHHHHHHQHQQQQRNNSDDSNAQSDFGTNTNNNFNNGIYNSCGSLGGISITVPVISTDNECDYQDLDVLRRSLETCCQILQQQQQMPCASFNSEESPVNTDLVKRYNDDLRSYVNSNTGSAVSSLANMGSFSSPPRATSPTDEVRELLEQIRQLQQTGNGIDLQGAAGKNEYHADQQLSQPPPHDVTAIANCCGGNSSTKRPSSFHTYNINNNINSNNNSHNNINNNNNNSKNNSGTSKKKFFNNKNNSKALYIPITNSNPKSIKSPIGRTNCSFLMMGKRSWISRSAPTTPGTGLPLNRFGLSGSSSNGSGTGGGCGNNDDDNDDSPLLDIHQEEDQN